MLSREDVGHIWHTLKTPGLWKLVLVLSALSGFLAEFVYKPAKDWITSERETRDKLIAKAVDAGVAKEAELRGKSDAEQAFKLSVLEQQTLAMWREHVRYVVASRKGKVDIALADFDALARGWPCRPPAVCNQPSVAATMVLNKRDHE